MPLMWCGGVYRKVQEFTGVHKGKPAAILGAGPSLRHLQPEWLDGFQVFAINSAFAKYPDCDYFVTGDSRRPNHWSWHQFQYHRCTVIMSQIGWWQPNLAEWAGVPKDRIVAFACDDPDTLPSNSSPHAAANIAILMGCDPIVLFGCDCSWNDEGKLHFHAYEGQPQDPIILPYDRRRPMTMSNTTGGAVIDGNQTSDIRVWGEIAKANPGVEILNASGGVLDVFPRIDGKDAQQYATGR